MDKEKLNEITEYFFKVSENCFDDEAKKVLREALDAPFEEARYRILALLDACVYYSWCSSFEIIHLRYIWSELGGLDQDEDRKNAFYRSVV